MGAAADRELRWQRVPASRHATSDWSREEEPAPPQDGQPECLSCENGEQTRTAAKGDLRPYIIAEGNNQPLRARYTDSIARTKQRGASFLDGPAALLGMRVLARRPDALLARISEGEAESLRARFPSLLIEEDLFHQPLASPLLGQLSCLPPPPGARELEVIVEGPLGPLAGAEVRVYRYGDPRPYCGTTDGQGRVLVLVDPTVTTFERCRVDACTAHWSQVRAAIDPRAPQHFYLRPLPLGGIPWGPQHTGGDTGGRHRGAGVRVCVIDSGIADHASLPVKDGRNFIHGEPHDDWRNDLLGHGTHCAGIIAAARRDACAWGYAPEVELFAARIFGRPGVGGSSFAIGGAIDWAVEQGCRIINMSFGHPRPSAYVQTKIEDARGRGVLVIAAAGNDGGPVLYPAAWESVIAVAAVGCRGTYPSDSPHAENERDAHGGVGDYADLYIPAFSNRGPEIDFCAPGVAISSTALHQGFACWDGTSMASPHVAGIASVALGALRAGADPVTQSPTQQLTRLLARLRASTLDLGLPRDIQGLGMLCLKKLLSGT